MIKIISKKQSKKKKRWVTSCVLAALLALTPCVFAAPAENSGSTATQTETSQTQINSTENQNTAAQDAQQNQGTSDQQNKDTDVDTTQYYEIQSAVDNHKVLDIKDASEERNGRAYDEANGETDPAGCRDLLCPGRTRRRPGAGQCHADAAAGQQLQFATDK